METETKILEGAKFIQKAVSPLENLLRQRRGLIELPLPKKLSGSFNNLRMRVGIIRSCLSNIIGNLYKFIENSNKTHQ